MGDRESETKKLLAKLEELEREEGEIEVLELGERGLNNVQDREEGEINGEDGAEEEHGEIRDGDGLEQQGEIRDDVVDGADGVDDKKEFTGDKSSGRSLAEDGSVLKNIEEVKAAAATAALVQVQAFECFVGDENGASSDMEIEEDIPSPLLMGTHVSAYFATESKIPVAGRPEIQSYKPDAPSEPMLKRKRLPDLGSNPVIQVSYEGLTRESKKKLQEALHQWSHWHSRRYSPNNGVGKEPLESGTDVYSPALFLDATSNNSVSVWMDRPSKLGRKSENEDVCGPASQEKAEEVPLYDRACVSVLSSQDLIDRTDGFISIEPEESSRCFNCGAYTHALLNCPRPRDLNAINTARRMHSDKKGGMTRGRAPTRYYQTSPGGKYDDIKPGALGNETRQSLGIGELDPPPWLHRMRELGYPPGYMEDPDDDESTEMEIFGGVGDEAVNEDGKEQKEDGEIVEKKRILDDLSVVKKMTVEFPGINAPIPENADKRLWTSPAEGLITQTQRGVKRNFQQLSTHTSLATGGTETGFTSHSFSWAVSPSDPPPRDGTTSGTNSNHTTPWNRHGSSPAYGLGNSSMEIGDGWKRRDGEPSAGVRSSGRESQQSLPSPTGHASPLSGMFRAPGFADMSSTQPSPHIYTRHSQYHTQVPQLSTLPSPNNPNEAWLKAQAALGVLQSDHKSGSSSSQPQWGRR